MLNELLWAAGIATVGQCYSMRGLDMVAAQNIATTINNLFSVIYFALGCSIAIVVGQKLGAGEIEETKKCNTQMIVFNLLISVVSGILLAFAAPLLPLFYNTTETFAPRLPSFYGLLRQPCPFTPLYTAPITPCVPAEKPASPSFLTVATPGCS